MGTGWSAGIVMALVALFAGNATAFESQGHRGARGLEPENTLEAFSAALSLGVGTLEMDTGITRDGVVVVTHNQRLEPAITRNRDGEWIGAEPPAIHALTYDELRLYDVGRINPNSRLAKNFTNQTPRDGAYIPRLEEVFRLVKRSGNDTVRFNIETKINPLEPSLSATAEVFAQSLVDLIKAHGLQERTTIQSFDWRTLAAVQQSAPDIQTVYLTAQQDWFNTVEPKDSPPGTWTNGHDPADHDGSVPAMIKAAGGGIWSPFYGDVDVEKIRQAHDLGLQVVVWTVNKEEDMRRLIGAGVDGIISDYPDRLRNVMADLNLPLPPATPVSPADL